MVELCCFTHATSLLTRGQNLQHLLIEANALLVQAKDWLTVNRLILNEDKTKSLLYTLKIQEIDDAAAVELLGFWMDS